MAVKQRMEERGVESLFLINESHIVYLTGYEGFSAYVPQGVLITLADSRPTLILREMDVLCATGTVYLEDDNILAYDEELLGVGEAPVWKRIGQIIASRASRGTLALERNARGLTVDNYGAFLDGLGTTHIVDGSGWLNAVRARKSAAELEYMRRAGAIVDHALLAGIGAIGRGVRQSDVAAEVNRWISAGTEAYPGNPPVVGPVMAVSDVANAPHLYWSSGVYRDGLQTNFETGAYQRRYCTALSRTAFLGKPSDRLSFIDAKVREAFEITLPAFKTGARCCDIYEQFWKSFSAAGIKKSSRIGYGIGIDWAEGGYSLQRDDTSVLSSDSTLHFIIGIWEREEGYVFSETLRVTDNGAQSFSRLPRKMFVIE
nr:Xaa-Pro peptidase family protein [Sinorhizobium mexicanum]